MTTETPTPAELAANMRALDAEATAAETAAGMLAIQSEELDKPRQAAFTAKRNAGTLDAYRQAEAEADRTHDAFIAVYLPYLDAHRAAIHARSRADKARQSWTDARNAESAAKLDALGFQFS